MTVRVRFPPSPTGELHVGNLRSALFNWLFARHEGGSFILRIEDTDRARYVPGATEGIMEALLWLGLDWDEGPDPRNPERDIGRFGPYVQSRRLEHYQRATQQLIEGGSAYRCYCSSERLNQVRQELQARKLPPKYDRHCRDLSQSQREEMEARGIPSVVRFKTPLSGETGFHDVIRGDLLFDNDTLDDFVLLKSDGYPVYHLASIVDDHLMQITHVMRGDEWVSSTPRHVLLYQAFGWQPPVFAHLPMILGPDRAKLSKRHGDTSVLEFRKRGFLPEALFNYLGLLGWSLDDHTELIDRETFVRHFSLERILASPAIFNFDKLSWMNGIYIRDLPPRELAARVRPFLEEDPGGPVDDALLQSVIPLIQERIKTLAEAKEMAGFFFVEGELAYSEADLLGKRFAQAPAEAARALEAALARLEALPSWEAEGLEGAVRPLADELGLKAGDLFGLIRVAVTGRTAAPPLFQTMAVLGRDKTVFRLQTALRKLASGAGRTQ
ncbi:MAG TPA: glutamate--tRNA ligase [Dehalococcoidia bacterium]|nr:glutamate--tRNA ligase [Dehalococcoidia bacterium]